MNWQANSKAKIYINKLKKTPNFVLINAFIFMYIYRFYVNLKNNKNSNGNQYLNKNWRTACTRNRLLDRSVKAFRNK